MICFALSKSLTKQSDTWIDLLEGLPLCHVYVDIWPWGILPFPRKINSIGHNQSSGIYKVLGDDLGFSVGEFGGCYKEVTGQK